MATILVIDDDQDMRDFMSAALDDGGHQVLTASDGDAGVEIFRDKQPDLVITDIVMPRKGGIETIIDIRRHWPTAKIIAISGGSAGPSDVLRVARVLGACDTLAKPFTAQALLSLVKHWSESPSL